MQYKRRNLPRIFGPGIYSFDSSIFIAGSFRRSVGAESSNPVSLWASSVGKERSRKRWSWSISQEARVWNLVSCSYCGCLIFTFPIRKIFSVPRNQSKINISFTTYQYITLVLVVGRLNVRGKKWHIFACGKHLLRILKYDYT